MAIATSAPMDCARTTPATPMAVTRTAAALNPGEAPAHPINPAAATANSAAAMPMAFLLAKYPVSAPVSAR
jgi:hypothetical protein